MPELCQRLRPARLRGACEATIVRGNRAICIILGCLSRIRDGDINHERSSVRRMTISGRSLSAIRTDSKHRPDYNATKSASRKLNGNGFNSMRSLPFSPPPSFAAKQFAYLPAQVLRTQPRHSKRFRNRPADQLSARAPPKIIPRAFRAFEWHRVVRGIITRSPRFRRAGFARLGPRYDNAAAYEQ